MKVKEFIENHYAEEIRIEDIAKRFRYSRSHLHKIFKTAYGCSITDYILSVRIEKGKFLLSDARPRTVSEAAFAVGFKDPLYFSRVFRKRVGLTPSEFKENARARRTAGKFLAEKEP